MSNEPMQSNLKEVFISVGEFALPSPRKGSIDVFSGFGRGAQIGMELHQKIQAARALENGNYKSEVQVSHRFEREGFAFIVGGRMDGFFDEAQPKIEEIKSSFNVYELLRRLKDGLDDHPYCLQVRTYGYMHWLQTKKIPDLSIHLVSSRNGDELPFSIALDVAGYERWLELRLNELVEEARLAEKRAKRRNKIAKTLPFPFERPRSGQLELIETIEAGMSEGRPMLIQAPTGLGKTIGVLYPTLKEAFTRGQKVVYITPKNSQHSVAEEAIEKLHDSGATIKALTITAKSKMCFKNEPLCNPEYCEYAKDHYTKIAQNGLIDQLRKKRSLRARTFKSLGEKYEVCPFELQLDAAQDVDVVICDYNYVFAPRSAFGRLASVSFDQEGKPNLVIDEAHNLPGRAMDSYSPSLSTVVLEKMQDDLKRLPRKFRKEAEKLLKESIAVLRACGPAGCDKPCRIEPPVEMFQTHDAELKAFLSSYLSADVDIQPKDVVLRLSFYWTEFTSALEFVSAGRKEFFTTFHPHPATVKITCCDASEMLKACYNDYAQVVAFSATLKPFEFYERLMGLEGRELRMAEFDSPFSKKRRKILVIPQVSTKYSERERNYPRIAEAIERIIALKRGNYFAFFPSFDFMERVFSKFTPPDGVEVIRQGRTMRRDDIDAVLGRLSTPGSANLVFAVQGGVFSEGVDYPGDMVIGAFVVGPPLPSFDLEQETRRDYYEANYSSGFDYAYTFPAMAKAIQAAGRVIRSETDRGIIVLMDNRFIQSSYAKSMPHDWFKESPRELISDSILRDISAFWKSVESED